MTDDLREPYLHDHLPAEHSWSCAYAPTRDDSRCGAPATWHGLILTWDCTDLRDVTAACNEHRPHVEAVADFVHAMDSVCELPGAERWWDGSTGASWCRLDWDPTASAVAVATTAGGAR
jgi:hypothetical protein